MVKDYRVVFTERERAELVEKEFDDVPAADEIVGKNILSLISTGSERGGYTQQFPWESYPMQTGSSSVAVIVCAGEGVTNLKEGDLVYHNGHHTLYCKMKAEDVIPLPEGVKPEHALFGRYAAVSMTSIFHATAKPVESVVVTGLGMVGLMCAQMANCFGYRVYATDPSEERRNTAYRAGLVNVGASLEEWQELKGSVATLYECSGNENALHAVIPYMRKRGEIFQIGVPWKKTSDWDAHTLLYELFYAFISIHGGWEWSIPLKSDELHSHSSFSHIRSAMEFIAEGKVHVPEEMYELRNPEDCGRVYHDITIPRMAPTSMMLDWRNF